MNSLFKKFLLYNFLGLALLTIGITVLIFYINNYQLKKRLSEIENQNLIIYNFLNSSNSFKNFDPLSLSDQIEKVIEIKSLSVLLLNNQGDIILDTKGYDVNLGGIIDQEPVEIESINSEDTNNFKSLPKADTLNRSFLKEKKFQEYLGSSQNGIKSTFSITQKNNQLGLFSILPINFDKNIFHIVAYEDNREIAQIINQIRFNILLTGLGIGACLILFSIFLNSIIIKPIRKLAFTAQNIDSNVKLRPLITSLDKREDEIGQLSKIINNMLNNLYSKIDNAENNSADLMHEIRNPLASIKMASEVITDKLKKDQKKFLNLIQNDISRIENIITDYSSMIKDEVNLYKNKTNTFDVRILLDEVINDLQKNISNKITFRLSYDNDNYQKIVSGQRSFLYQAIENILNNAISFSPKSGVIKISLSSTENYVSISIIDQGPGVNEPDMMKIFDRFYSLRENDENSQIHSGLGLSISKQIIDAHDGYISVDNLTSENRTVGAKFIINLPLSNNKK